MAQMENTAEVICSLPDLREEKVLASFLLRLVAQYPKHMSHLQCLKLGTCQKNTLAAIESILLRCFRIN